MLQYEFFEAASYIVSFYHNHVFVPQNISLMTIHMLTSSSTPTDLFFFVSTFFSFFALGFHCNYEKVVLFVPLKWEN